MQSEYTFSRWLWSSMIQKSSKISFWALSNALNYCHDNISQNCMKLLPCNVVIFVCISCCSLKWKLYLSYMQKRRNVFEGRKGMICCLLFHSIFLMWTFACVKKEWYKQFFTFSKRLLTKARQNIKQSAESKVQIQKCRKVNKYSYLY